jgi:DNA-binding GntR family transcriptional regulator
MPSSPVNAASKTSASASATTSREEEGLLARWEATRQAQEWSSAAEAVRATLMAAIVNRELPPGWRLSEERLVALFKVSRTPIREALMAVAGTSLARRDERGRLRVAALTAEQILGAYTVRRSLEGLAASLAASAPTPQLIARLRELNRQCADAADHEDFDAMMLVNCDFHATIAAATGNEMLIRYTDDLLNWLKRIGTTTLAEGRAPGAVREHEEIIDAIECREPELADRLAEEHVRRAEQVRIQMLARAPDDLSARTPK